MSGGRTSRASVIFLTASSIVAAGAVLLGLWMTPPPWRQRVADQDRRRVSDLIHLSQAIFAYRRANGTLPASLQKLPDAPSLRRADPITGADYEYILNDTRAFQLCAAFNAASDEPVTSFPPEASAWKHQAGRQCFSVSLPQGPT